MNQKSNKEYTCFFITPIGEPDSPERKNSDMVLKNLITPALRLCGFQGENIVRSDKEEKPGRITERMIQHIKNDDLCIVDLTGLNANVMYEYGMRKGIGKSAVVIARKGTIMPFDVYDENTIFYDISDFTAFFEALEKLERVVRALVNEKFDNSADEGSVSDIIKRLLAIEDKLDSVVSVVTSNPAEDTIKTSGGVNEILRELGPIGAFNYALRQRDLSLGEDLMPRLEQTVDKDTFLDSVVAQLAAMGSEKAGTILKAEWPYISKNFPFAKKYEALGSYVSYCNRRDCEPENLEFLVDEAERMYEVASSNEEKAGVYCQLSRLYHGVYSTLRKRGDLHTEYLDEATNAMMKATELNPEEASYFFNLAACYIEQDEEEKAFEAINQCMDLGTDDEDHLALAHEIYKGRRSPRADAVYKKLYRINPFRAEMLD